MKIRKNDNVAIIAGKDKGKTGIVSQVFPSAGKVVVAGVAVYKKSLKPSKKAPHGGIVEINAKIPVSNVAIICPSCAKIGKISYSTVDGKKIRVCRKCQASLETVK